MVFINRRIGDYRNCAVTIVVNITEGKPPDHYHENQAYRNGNAGEAGAGLRRKRAGSAVLAGPRQAVDAQR